MSVLVFPFPVWGEGEVIVDLYCKQVVFVYYVIYVCGYFFCAGLRVFAPFCLSLMHSMHIHTGEGMCVPFCSRSLCFLDILIRSSTVFVLCLFSMHLALMFMSGHCCAPGWCHARRDALTFGESRIVASFVSYLLAIFSILLMFFV